MKECVDRLDLTIEILSDLKSCTELKTRIIFSTLFEGGVFRNLNSEYVQLKNRVEENQEKKAKESVAYINSARERWLTKIRHSLTSADLNVLEATARIAGVTFYEAPDIFKPDLSPVANLLLAITKKHSPIEVPWTYRTLTSLLVEAKCLDKSNDSIKTLVSAYISNMTALTVDTNLREFALAEIPKLALTYPNSLSNSTGVLVPLWKDNILNQKISTTKNVLNLSCKCLMSLEFVRSQSSQNVAELTFEELCKVMDITLSEVFHGINGKEFSEDTQPQELRDIFESLDRLKFFSYSICFFIRSLKGFHVSNVTQLVEKVMNNLDSIIKAKKEYPTKRVRSLYASLECMCNIFCKILIELSSRLKKSCMGIFYLFSAFITRGINISHLPANSSLRCPVYDLVIELGLHLGPESVRSIVRIIEKSVYEDLENTLKILNNFLRKERLDMSQLDAVFTQSWVKLSIKSILVLQAFPEIVIRISDNSKYNFERIIIEIVVLISSRNTMNGVLIASKSITEVLLASLKILSIIFQRPYGNFLSELGLCINVLKPLLNHPFNDISAASRSIFDSIDKIIHPRLHSTISPRFSLSGSETYLQQDQKQDSPLLKRKLSKEFPDDHEFTKYKSECPELNNKDNEVSCDKPNTDENKNLQEEPNSEYKPKEENIFTHSVIENEIVDICEDRGNITQENILDGGFIKYNAATRKVSEDSERSSDEEFPDIEIN